MKKLSLILMICICLLLTSSSLTEVLAQSDTLQTVQIEASPSILEVLKTWDTNILFLTPSEKPIRSLEDLTRKNVACWGAEHFQRMLALFEALGIEGEGVKVIGDGAFNSAQDKPLLYVTWAKYVHLLKGVSRVEFIEEKPSTESEF